MINLLDNATNQQSRFRIRNCVEINNAARGTCNPNDQTKFKTKTLKSSLCDSSDAYITLKRTKTVATNTSAPLERNDKQVLK